MAIRKDYGPAGCAEGCAERSAKVAVLFALVYVLLGRRKRK